VHLSVHVHPCSPCQLLLGPSGWYHKGTTVHFTKLKVSDLGLVWSDMVIKIPYPIVGRSPQVPWVSLVIQA